MNPRLSASTSPYLRAHAGNPVAWYPWGAEAFAEAARRDVPVMISIGYSTCHWCHVMARESFADAATAAAMNDGFVSIKVDREEHPEVDAAYLTAAGAFTPHLGWPLTVFATPTGRTFYAGTYFPPEPRPPLPSFRDVLAAVTEAWDERRDEVGQTATAVGEAVARAASRARAGSPASGAGGGDDGEALPTLPRLAEAARAVAAREDGEFGGFAPANAALQTPKFPVAPALSFLQARALREPEAAASGVAVRALEAMAASPLHDEVGGGFFRYATRRDWTVPHYEKMLTDNAQLVDIALAAGDEDLARQTAGYLVDVLQQPAGGLAAAQDSESVIDGARSEGGYYLSDAAARASLDPPAIDAKVVTGWNGLAIGALARAAARLDDDRLRGAARWAADAVLEANVRADGTLARASLDEIASPASATLEDYGALAGGLAALAATTGEAAYAVRARDLVDACLPPSSREDPVVPGGGDPVLASFGLATAADASDGDHPSGPASFAEAAVALWLLGAGERYRDAAAAVVRRTSATALAEPFAHGALLSVAARLAAAPRQVVVIEGGHRDLELLAAARRLEADAVVLTTPEGARRFAEEGFELLEGKSAVGDATTVYDCRDFTCRLPATAASELA